jgi:hypothetical protein
VDIELTPDPAPEEREAIEAAVQKLIAGSSAPAAYRSAWRVAGIREAVEDQAAEARPRSSFGATRA